MEKVEKNYKSITISFNLNKNRDEELFNWLCKNSDDMGVNASAFLKMKILWMMKNN